ncbi:MAG: DUF6249 domain-containing protein [Burkholderiales bacterium]|nr:DUF6249 domain-containing protein [Burkholderiales bacterium]
MDFGTTILGAMGIVLGLMLPVLLVGLILWYKARRIALLHATALKLAEKGQPVPPSLFADQAGPKANLRQGVVLLMLGLGICVALYLSGIKFWAAGIIPLFTGLGYLIVWKLEDGDSADSASIRGPK